MFVHRGVGGDRVAARLKERHRAKAADPLSLNLSALAPAGYYIALRVGFAFPVEEVNELPSSWVQEYTMGGYMLSDPLIGWCYSETGVCRWSEMTVPDRRGVMVRAQAHGLRFGAATSILDAAPGGQRSYATFARADREFTDEELSCLEEHLRARHRALHPPQNITEAEIEALRLIKSGQRLKQIAFQLGVTEGAIKQRLKNARVKLSAKTGAEAISRAATFGLI